MRYTPNHRRRASGRITPIYGALLVAGLTAASLSGCSSSGAGSAGTAAGKKASVAVTLITKDTVNPYFIAMQKGAEAAAKADGVSLTTAAGKTDGDTQSQISAIEDAVARGDKGILITPSGPGVEAAMKKAKDAGVTVIALDTPPSDPSSVDATYATDNVQAGEMIGKWASKAVHGSPLRIALLDAFSDQVVSVDVDRGQGFLLGMGIISKAATRNGGEPKSGAYNGGNYTVVCQEATQAAQDGGRSAMERCLSKTTGIDLVYAANEPSAFGAVAALKAAGLAQKVKVVTVDGGCQAMGAIGAGTISATAQQYPLKMAEDGVKAVAAIARGGAAPSEAPGSNFISTGATLVTNTPVSGVPSIDSAAGSKVCW